MSKTDQDLYLDMSYRQAKLVTEMYSTSFSRSIATLGDPYRKHVYAVYAFVRLGDEIVDAGFEIDSAKVLAEFEKSVETALSEGFSTNPVLHAFQDTAHLFNIKSEPIQSFFKSMEMDTKPNTYTPESFQTYVYGSAEAVGLMCLSVFCNGDEVLYEKLIKPARALGSAFQKVNFLRDIQADTRERGRSYFPGIDFSDFSNEQKRRIEADIEREYDIAAQVLDQLPKEVSRGIDLALTYYRQLLFEIRKVSAATLLERRIRVSNLKKVVISLYIKIKYR